MSQATVVFTANKFPFGVDTTERHQNVFGTLAISASPDTYTANGLPIELDSYEYVKSGYPALSPPVVLSPPQPTFPVWADIDSLTGINSYVYDPVHGTLRIFVSGTEVAGGAAIPAGVSGDTIFAVLQFQLDI